MNPLSKRLCHRAAVLIRRMLRPGGQYRADSAIARCVPLCLPLLIFSYSPQAAEPVFVLHSYSQEYPWTLGQHQGFMEALKADPVRSYDVRVEYMDTKRVHYTADYGRQIAEYLKTKYVGYQPAAVYVSDDNALSFAQAHMATVFPGVPVFFSGINNFAVKAQLDSSRMTGVFERKDIAPNLALMKAIGQGEGGIAVIGDASETYRAIEAGVRAELAKQTGIRARFISSERIDELVARLRDAKVRFVFLTTLGEIRNAEGRTLTLAETLDAIVKAGDFIILSMEDVYLQPGVLGGWVTSGLRQGLAAAGLLRRHLDGASLDALPPVEDSPNEYIFDDAELLRAGVTLPEPISRQARHLDMQPSFYEANRTLVLGAFYSLSVLLVMSLVGTVFIYARKNRIILATSLRLSESESRFRNLFDSSPDPIWIIDDYHFTECNQAAATQLGYANKELLCGKHPGDLSPKCQPDGEDSHVKAERMMDLAQERGINRFEWVHTRADGTDFFAEVTLSAITLRDRPAIYCTWRDISERKQVEDALLESEESFRLLVEQSVDGILVTDAQNRYVEANPAACRMLGYSRGEILGLTIADMVLKEEVQRITPDMARFSSGEILPSEYQCRRKDGSVFIGEVTGSPLPDGRFLGILRDITDRKKIAGKLRSALSQLEMATMAAGIGIWVWDIANNALVWDERMFEIYGASAETRNTPLLYEFWRSRVHPEDIRLAETKLQQQLDGTGYFDLIFRIAMPDGEIRFVEAAAYVERDESGKPLRMVGINRDITDLKRIEEASRKASRYARNLIEASLDPLVTISPAGKITDVNHATEAVSGRSREELIGSGFSDYFTEPDSAGAGYRKAFAAGSVTDYPLAIRHTSGHVTEVLCNATVYRNDAGEVEGVFAAARDVTERNRSEAELRQYRQNLEALVEQRTADLKEANKQLVDTQFAMDSVGIGIEWLNPETGQFIYVNQYAANLMDLTPEEMLGLTVFDINPDVSTDIFVKNMEAVRKADHIQIETIHRSRDGRDIPVEVSLYLHDTRDGTPAKLIAFVTNITHRKEAEKALLQAKEAAEAANIAKSAFLANMSHEIRTPLNGITGMAHLIRRGGLTPQQAERMDKLEAASQHLLSIINAVLELSKIEAGRFSLEESPVRIESLVGNVTSILRERADAKQLVLRTEVEPMPCGLLGDPTRLQQAMLNYAGNAVKFTETGSITLRVRPLEESPDDILIRFEVQDTGHGIAPETLSRLFTAFEQADNTTTRKYGGTGLGLAITKKLAQLMGGDAGAESELGVGSTFWFSVRLKKDRIERLPVASTSEDSAELALRRDFLAARILLAEDEPINREVTLMLLDDVGLVVDVAEDGAEALKLAAGNDYALILMDMQMPVMDGLEATQRIRRLPQRGQIPIVAMTANAFAEDRTRCLDAGMNDFIARAIASSNGLNS